MLRLQLLYNRLFSVVQFGQYYYYSTQHVHQTPKQRVPIVTVMGHVDHGKTTLLDTLRKSNTADKEPGGITQHLRAFRFKDTCCFLDTPGHEAFKAIRERGAKATDIVILVVALDDGVMRETAEIVKMITMLKLPMIVAMTKCDLFEAKSALEARKLRIADELSKLGILLEGPPYMGDTQHVQVSAIKNVNLDNLLEAISAEASILNLDYTTEQPAQGMILETRMDPGQGRVATVILRSGQLSTGDWIVSGSGGHGRVKRMVGSDGESLNCLNPSWPVLLSGFRDNLNAAGDEIYGFKSESEARSFLQLARINGGQQVLTGDYKKTNETTTKEQEILSDKRLEVIIKADTSGSADALELAILKMSKRVQVNIIRKEVGPVNMADAMLVESCTKKDAVLLVSFNNPSIDKDVLKKLRGHLVLQEKIIYTVLDQIRAKIISMLPKQFIMRTIGKATVKKLFSISVGKTPVVVAGCLVSDGLLRRSDLVKVIRNETVVYEELAIKELRSGKDPVKEVKSGMECGLMMEKPLLEGDMIEGYVKEEKPYEDI